MRKNAATVASLAIMRPDLEMMRLLFLPDALRTTTVLMGLLLLAFGLIRRRPLQGFLAAMAWIVAYEAAWQLTAYCIDGRPLGWPIVPAAVAALAISLFAGVAVDLRWLLLTAGLWLVWIVSGYHYNMPWAVPFDWWGELMNEATKIAWGMAYLWPLLRSRKAEIWLGLPAPVAWGLVTAAVGGLAVAMGS
jgi:hypothetical protein